MAHSKLFRRRFLGSILVGLALATIAQALPVRGAAPPEIGRVELTAYQAGKVTLEGGTDWINTKSPIHIEDLRGKIVLLDFWTYCCINCHHVLPDLAYLEQKYKNELVVIGVHKPKFNAERETENIRKKVAEYRIKHPVINDANDALWNRFGVQSWPTLVVIDAMGNYVGYVAGEGKRAILDEVIGKLVAQHKQKHELNETPIQFYSESDRPQKTGLLYPGKLAADARGKRLFISDTGHNRIVITDLSGKVQAVVGTGDEGLQDGAYDKARFNRQQGLLLVGETLYVADTENHAIRAIDLKNQKVTTVAGTGRQSQRREGHGPAKTTGLNSPWDLVPIPGSRSLAVAMAGPHQIWKFDPEGGTIGVWAGSGLENIVDGSATTSAFAQPSGLASDGQSIFVADSEVSGVRKITIGKNGEPAVGTVVGMGLFDFGDVDGQGGNVRLQHCLGLAYADGKLYIADSYNNKVKVCDPKSRTVKTFLGSGEAGSSDDPARFDEPGGLSIADGTLYIADTNNHLVRAADLKTGKVSTLAIDLEPPVLASRPLSFPNAAVTNAPAASVAPGGQVAIDVALSLPAGYKLNPEAPLNYRVEESGQGGLLASSAATKGTQLESAADHFRIDVPLAQEAKAGQKLTLKVSVSAFLCNDKSGLCTVKSYIWTVPVTFAEGSPGQVSLSNAPKS